MRHIYATNYATFNLDIVAKWNNSSFAQFVSTLFDETVQNFNIECRFFYLFVFCKCSLTMYGLLRWNVAERSTRKVFFFLLQLEAAPVLRISFAAFREILSTPFIDGSHKSVFTGQSNYTLIRNKIKTTEHGGTDIWSTITSKLYVLHGEIVAYNSVYYHVSSWPYSCSVFRASWVGIVVAIKRSFVFVFKNVNINQNVRMQIPHAVLLQFAPFHLIQICYDIGNIF